MSEFSSTEDISIELSTFIKKAEALTGLNFHETKTLSRKQDDIFSFHQLLNTTFAMTLTDEKVKNENIINPDIVNMVSGLNLYNNQIIDMNEVNRISLFRPKIYGLKEMPTCTADSDKCEEILEEGYSESKSSSFKNEESSNEDTDEEDKDTSDCSAYETEDMLDPLSIGATTDQTEDKGRRYPENINKINLVHDSSSTEINVDQPKKDSNANDSIIIEAGVDPPKENPNNTMLAESELMSSEMVDEISSNQRSYRTPSEVVTKDQEPAATHRKEKLSVFKRIFRRKKE